MIKPLIKKDKAYKLKLTKIPNQRNYDLNEDTVNVKLIEFYSKFLEIPNLYQFVEDGKEKEFEELMQINVMKLFKDFLRKENFKKFLAEIRRRMEVQSLVMKLPMEKQSIHRQVRDLRLGEAELSGYLQKLESHAPHCLSYLKMKINKN
jgi:hypothetical protein